MYTPKGYSGRCSRLTTRGSNGERTQPDDCVYPYILPAYAQSWRGSNIPSEWKHMMYSSDPKKRKDPHGEITLDKDNPPSPAPR